MTALRRPGRPAAIVVLAVASLLALLAPLAPVAPLVRPAAAATDFGTPTARSTFGEAIVFSQPLVLDRGVIRVEILVETPGAVGPYVSPVEFDAIAGQTTLSHRIEAADGSFSPNTRFAARWRVVRNDGTSDLGPAASVTYVDTRFSWRTRSGDVVRVHWYEGSDAFGARALEIGENAVEETAALLGVRESAPVDFFVYADRDAFYDALGPASRENVGGRAITETRTMFALISPDAIDDAWVGTVIPHELVHLVFDTAVDNPYHYPAHWLNEGLAVYLSEGYAATDRTAVERAAADGTLIPLDGLIGQFPTSRERFFLAYSVSVSAVDFLVRTWGRDALVALVRSYADGVSDDEAFEAAIGIDTTAFDRAWRDELGAVEPIAYGPQPALPGPLPPGWDEGPASSPAPGAPTAGPGPSATPGGAPSADDDGPGLAIVLAAVAIVVAGVGAGLLIADRRRRA